MGTSLYDQYQASLAPPAAATPAAPPTPTGPPSLYDAYLASKQPGVATTTPADTQPGVFSRAWDQVKGVAEQAFTHPIDTAESLVSAPVRSLVTAMSPAVGDARPDGRLSKGGNSSAAPIDTSPYDAAHGAVTLPQRVAALAQTAATIAAPSLAGGIGGGLAKFVGPTIGRLWGAAVAGAGAGAAYDPSDPGAGALAGAFLAPVADVGVRAAATVPAGIASKVLDMSGARPMETQPLLTVGGQGFGAVQGLSDRAADVNARAIGSTPTTDGLTASSAKPVAPLDVAGTAGVRAARNLKTVSPAAEAVIRSALEDRDAGAVDRVIQQGLEATGLQTRESGLQLATDLIAQRTAAADAAWPQIFQNNPQAINDPRIADVMATDSGPKAFREVPGLMKDRFLPTPDGATASPTSTATTPTGNPADDNAVLYAKLLKANGGDGQSATASMRTLGAPTPVVPSAAGAAPSMNLQQLHYWAKALDDMGESGANRGPGATGNGYNKGIGIQKLAQTVRQIAKEASPDYAAASQQYASDSDLIRGADLGRNLFRLHPDEAQQALAKLPADAQQVARRTGFDALAERIENGPADVEKGVSKVRDQARMRLLFPDDASFGRFKQGLAEEAQMHANTTQALGGSNTADKLADAANMAGVSLPDVLRAAASGRWHYFGGRVLANVSRKLLSTGDDAIAAERAKQLVAGANGDVPARVTALNRMGVNVPTASGIAAAPLPAAPPPRAPLLLRGWQTPPEYFDPSGARPGTAMPIPQPLPLSRRLPSWGPTAVATPGNHPLGPAIPMRGQSLDDAVQQTLMHIYHANPRYAVSLSREDQAALANEIRARLTNPR